MAENPPAAIVVRGETPVPSFWDKLNARIPILTSLVQFLLVTLLGTFAKCSVDDYTRSTERIKRVDDLSLVLSTQRDGESITRQNLSLVTLDRFLSTPNPNSWFRLLSSNEREADDSLMFNIAEEVYRARVAAKAKSDTTLVQARLDLAARIMYRHDPERGNAVVSTFKLAALGKTRSLPDAPNAVPVQPFASLAIAHSNIALVNGADGEGAVNNGETKPICYIQFRGFTREVAQSLQQQLQQVGWNAPGVESVAGNYSCSVRYYFVTDFAKAEKARQIAQNFLNKQSGSPKINLFSLVKRKFTGVKKGQIEIWISPGYNK